jgi:antitoxin (DNA-binding transcriptional repressor) of toxin-antitoxin stability system
MKASIVDLRYHMKDVLRALERNEEVYIVSRGKVKGVIKPVDGKPPMKVQDHPFFGMRKDDRETVERQMDRLRGGRYRDL